MRLSRARTSVVAHVETARPYTTCYVGLVGLAGAVLVDPHAGVGRLAAAWLVPTLAWLAGLYGGDFFDRELDAEAKPYRPIPSGRLRASTALTALIVFAAGGAALGIAVNWRSAVWAGAALGCGLAYSAVLKARGLIGNIARGAMTACAFWFGASMVSDWPPLRIVPVALVFVAHDIASNLIGTLRDVDGDRAGGYATLPVRRGVEVTTHVVLLGLGLAYLGAVALPPGRLSAPAAALLLAAAVSAGRAPGLVCTRPLTRERAYRAHEIVVGERILLAGALVTRGAGAWAVPVVAVLIALALTTQRRLRGRSEGLSAQAATLGAAEVLSYVDTQLAALDAGRLSALQGWCRVVVITLTEPELRVRLHVRGGAIVRLADDEPRPADPCVEIGTSGAVFADIFLHGRTNPRRAYLGRRLTMQAGPRDMMHLNQLFNEFRASSPAPAGTTTAHERVPDAPDDRMPERVVVSDTTLRDGEQMPGVAFAPATKVELARRLVAAGIPLLEVGFPAVSDDERSAIKRIVDADLDAVIQVIARPSDGDVTTALDCGAGSVAIFIGTSPAHLTSKLRIDLDEACRRVERSVRRVKAAGRQAVFAAEDATRTSAADLARIFGAAAAAGADAVGVADTAGVASPWTMRALVAEVAEQCPLPIAVHAHNDLGLATANSIAGVLGGASGVQCSVLGIGERAGNAPLEQVVLALEVAMNTRTGVDPAALAPLATYVGHLVGHPVPPFMPVVGDHAFVHESGLHVDGVNRDPSTYEPYPPALTGRQRRIVLGKHSGRSAVAEIAAQHGFTVTDQDVERVLHHVKSGRNRTASAVELIKEQLTEGVRT